MATSSSFTLGTVVSLRRYPVKSMQGEELNAAWVTPRGVLGDRALALVDAENGKVVSAKNPKKWPAMFDFRSEFVEPPRSGMRLPPVRITLPDGTSLTSTQPDIEELLSQALSRPVRLASAAAEQPVLEEYWPDMEEFTQRNTVTDETISAGTFFDGAPVHLLTTTTLNRLREAYPQGRFEVRRFRPNIVVQGAEGEADFLEDRWVDRTVTIGDEVQLRIWRRCPRCVMTTLPQVDLPADQGILRTAAQQNEGFVGVYATVVRPGAVRRGDPVRFDD
jgi:uncharacterized protein YcbX